MFYSFFATCKKYDINPEKCLVYVINHIQDSKMSELKNLLPQFFDKICSSELCLRVNNFLFVGKMGGGDALLRYQDVHFFLLFHILWALKLIARKGT
jgi:hypothetical protein